MPLRFEVLSHVCSLEFPDSSVSPRRQFTDQHGSIKNFLVHSFVAVALQSLQNLCLNPAETVGHTLKDSMSL